jgi:hypothetical protein
LERSWFKKIVCEFENPCTATKKIKKNRLVSQKKRRQVFEAACGDAHIPVIPAL